MNSHYDQYRAAIEDYRLGTMLGEMMSIPLAWKQEILLVDRLVLPNESVPADYRKAVVELAERLHLETASEFTDPRPGDFWLACQPSAGWPEGMPKNVGHAAADEIAPAVLRLLTAASWHQRRQTTSSRSSPWASGSLPLAASAS